MNRDFSRPLSKIWGLEPKTEVEAKHGDIYIYNGIRGREIQPAPTSNIE